MSSAGALAPLELPRAWHGLTGPRLTRTGDEAVAVTPGLLAAERTGLPSAAGSVRVKIDRVLPEDVSDGIPN